MRNPRAIILMAVLCAGGCDLAAPGSPLSERLQAEDPAERIEAIQEAVRRDRQEAVGLIVERLGDSDRDVRFFAIIGLEKLTGRTMGYEHWAPAADRAEAIERWRAWLEAGRPDEWPPGGTDATPADEGNGGGA
jgi:hypothetical protein